MPDYYEILELKKDASQQEIKRAYFRLIRQHTPDSDPEGFMKIREAYEALKSGSLRKSGPSFSVPSDPVAAVIYKSIEDVLPEKNMSKILELAEFGAKGFPNEPYFLYHLQIAQRSLRYSGKAVKTGEKLYAMDRNNPWYCRELTLSYLERGYIKKAISQYQRSWKLGVRDAEFTALAISASNKRDYITFAISYGMQFMKEKTSWAKDELEAGTSICYCLVTHLNRVIENADEIVEVILQFLELNFRELREEGDELTCALLIKTVLARTSEESLDRVLAFAETHRKELSKDSIVTLDFVRVFRRAAKLSFVSFVSNDIKNLVFLQKSDYSDPGLYEYACLDFMLILMKRAQVCQLELSIIEEEYPEAYELRRPFFDLFKDPEALKQKMDEYRIRFRKMSSDYAGAAFYELYPDERKKSIPQAASPEFREIMPRRKFARSIVGRNDPCPCGSGRKFKKCCMGKGIFD